MFVNVKTTQSLRRVFPDVRSATTLVNMSDASQTGSDLDDGEMDVQIQRLTVALGVTDVGFCPAPAQLDQAAAAELDRRRRSFLLGALQHIESRKADKSP